MFLLVLVGSPPMNTMLQDNFPGTFCEKSTQATKLFQIFCCWLYLILSFQYFCLEHSFCCLLSESADCSLTSEYEPVHIGCFYFKYSVTACDLPNYNGFLGIKACQQALRSPRMRQQYCLAIRTTGNKLVRNVHLFWTNSRVVKAQGGEKRRVSSGRPHRPPKML